MAKSYYEKLKDPRWQRKRLEVLDREKFTCQGCGDSQNTLHVHHGFYRRGCDPWEYPDSSLHVLCEGCHEVIQERLDIAHEVLGILGPAELNVVCGILDVLVNTDFERLEQLLSELSSGTDV